MSATFLLTSFAIVATQGAGALYTHVAIGFAALAARLAVESRTAT